MGRCSHVTNTNGVCQFPAGATAPYVPSQYPNSYSGVRGSGNSSARSLHRPQLDFETSPYDRMSEWTFHLSKPPRSFSMPVTLYSNAFFLASSSSISCSSACISYSVYVGPVEVSSASFSSFSSSS